MKKAVFILLFFMLLVIPLALAAENTTKLEKAYSCLQNQVKNHCEALGSVEEKAFSLLALAYDSSIKSECKTALDKKSTDSECWTKDDCNLKDTALATLALQHSNYDATKPEKWLLLQNGSATDLEWFLEIDSGEATTCKVNYDDHDYTITMAGDKKLSGTLGSCLEFARSNYWLRIKESCLAKNFKIQCDKFFSTALLYQKKNSDTDVWHISSLTKSASASGFTEHQVNSVCLLNGDNCDYEGTLWGVLALAKNYDVSSFMPYLVALAPDHPELNPYAFIYKIKTLDEYLINVKERQNPAGFWEIGEQGKVYDTALSLYAVPSEDETFGIGKTWLFDNQDTNGCWQNSVRDTAFVLYAIDPKAATGSVDTDMCEDHQKHCTPRMDCIDAGGEELDNFFCSGSASICCSVEILEKTCDEKDGKVCASDEDCSIATVSSFDKSNCCTGSCDKRSATPECEQEDYNCRISSCNAGEIQKNYDCSSTSEVCCSIDETDNSGGGGAFWWILLLIILIALVVLGIMFRNQLRVYIFKMRSGFKKGPVNQTRPGFPPGAGGAPRVMRPMFQPRPMPQPVQRPGAARPKSKLDTELDETLKKLKEMSK